MSTKVFFFTSAIVEIYQKYVLISRNFAEFREIQKPQNSAKVRNFDIIDVGIPRNFDNNDIGIPRNLERLMSVSSKLRTFAEFRFRYYRNFDILRNSDIVIIDSSKFRKNSIFR